MNQPFLAILLSVVLMITAQGMAFARAQAPADGHMVLCTGHGSIVVYVDEDGQPTSAPQLCSDAAQAFFASVDAAPLMAFAPVSLSVTVIVPEPVNLAGRAARSGSARGPPVV